MASQLFHQPPIAPADAKMVSEISQQLGLEIPDDQHQDYVDLVNEVLSAASIINDIPQPKPEVAFPRTPGYRPDPKDNIYNAWYMKTEIKGAPSGVLAGKRIAIKDNIAVAAVPMMNGCSLIEGHIPDYDATIVTRILKAGGTITGKAVCENLCFSGNSFTAATGPVLNPVDPRRSTGGSSSGCGALVAAGEVDMAIGGDQGGSIRIPSSWCGIVGLKPTFSLVPFTGAMGLYNTVDHLGPMTRNVTDCAALLQAIAGPHELDPRQNPSIQVPNYLEAIGKDVNGMKIGILKEGFEACTEEEVKTIVKAGIEKLKEAGCSAEEVSVPFQNSTAAFFSHILHPGVYEVVKNGGVLPGTGGWHDVSLAKMMKQNIKYNSRDLSTTMKMVVLTGEILKKQDNYNTFAKAENLLPAFRQAYNDVLEKYDVLIMPTLPFTAPELPGSGPLKVKEYANHALSMVTNTSPFNLTGHPAITINAGYTQELKLPVGMMIVGKHFDDATVLRVARAFEKATGAE